MLQRIIILAGFLVMFFVMRYYSGEFSKHDQPGIVKLEFARANDGKSILRGWEQTKTGSENLLNTAKTLTWYDFLFVISYVALLMMLSWTAKTKEKSTFLRNLLHVNFNLAIVAGAFDLIENGILLFDINHSDDSTTYLSSYWFTLFKFLLIAWIILGWIISLVKRFVVK
jgi:hypothetical protein